MHFRTLLFLHITDAFPYITFFHITDAFPNIISILQWILQYKNKIDLIPSFLRKERFGARDVTPCLCMTHGHWAVGTWAVGWVDFH